MRLKRRRKVRKLVAGSLAFIACLAMGMTMFFLNPMLYTQVKIQQTHQLL